MKHYPERQTFWDACIQTKALDSFVNALFDEYLGLVDGFKGREKYTSLLVQWLCCIQYEPKRQNANSKKWSLAVKKVQLLPSKPT